MFIPITVTKTPLKHHLKTLIKSIPVIPDLGVI